MSVYLDNNATTPLRDAVKRALITSMDIFGNPSAIHRFGQDAKILMDGARRRLADYLGVRSEQIIFTSGGSESSVMCLRGLLKNVENPHLVLSYIEHAATFSTAKALENEGVKVSYVRVDASGKIDVTHLEEILKNAPVTLVSLQWANNETGVIQPVEYVQKLCKEYGAYLHVDAVQMFGKTSANLAQLNADAISLTFHKCGGPKGIGALVLKNELKMSALITGGAQERNRRAGTENTLAIGTIETLVNAIENNTDELKHIQTLRNTFESCLKDIIPEVEIVGETEERLLNTSQIILKNVSAELLVMALDVAHIAVSQGSACSSGRTEPSRVLLAMGYSEAEALSAIRVSFAWHNTTDDVEKLLEALIEVLQKMK